MTKISPCVAFLFLALHGNSEHMELAQGGAEAIELYPARGTLPTQCKTFILELKLKLRVPVMWLMSSYCACLTVFVLCPE